LVNLTRAKDAVRTPGEGASPADGRRRRFRSRSDEMKFLRPGLRARRLCAAAE